MRIWARGVGALLAAGAAGVLSWTLLGVFLPSPTTRPPSRPVLETVTPAQLAAMNVRLDPTLQPVQSPDWLRGLGIGLPAGIKVGDDAEAAVRRTSGGVRAVTERVLAYATVSNRSARTRGPTIHSRLVWALAGTRAVAGSVGGFVQVIWLVDARSAHQLAELTVLAPAPAGAGSGSGGP